MFPAYEQHTEIRQAEAWKNGLFVFDTNVLLNLYRYQSTTRDSLLGVIEMLADRIWIPHHVALEFQRNRLAVLTEQSRRFSDVRKVIEKVDSLLREDLGKLQLHKRHALIDPQLLIAAFSDQAAAFLDQLNDLSHRQQPLTGPDPLKDQIENLFEGRVGNPPASQAQVDLVYKEASSRFSLKIPPGYKDFNKGEEGLGDAYRYGGIIYKKRFGDVLIWQQILEHAKTQGVKELIFVTGDTKEDWWTRVDCGGRKTLGARPELKDEAYLEGGINTLLFHTPEGFLETARKLLRTQVSEETVQEVREVTQSHFTRDASNLTDLQTLLHRAFKAVKQWLCLKYPTVRSSGASISHFSAEMDSRSYEYRVIPIPLEITIGSLHEQVLEPIKVAAATYKPSTQPTALTVTVVSTEAALLQAVRDIVQGELAHLPEGFRVVFGTLEESLDGKNELFIERSTLTAADFPR